MDMARTLKTQRSRSSQSGFFSFEPVPLSAFLNGSARGNFFLPKEVPPRKALFGLLTVLFPEVPLQQAVESATVAGFVLGHFIE